MVRESASKTAAATAVTARAADGASSKGKMNARSKSKSSSKNSKGKAPTRSREDSVLHLYHPLSFQKLMLLTVAVTESSEDEACPEKQPPEQAEPEHTTATAAPDLIRQIHETSRDIEKNHKMMRKLASVDPAEKAKQDAVFSYNVIDLTALPLGFKNPFNPRPVVASKVREMRNALLEEGLRIFSDENRIMIVIKPSHVETSCITSDPTAPALPFCLKEGAPISELTVIGGQHRRDAVLLIKSDHEAKMERLQGSIKLRNKVLKGFVRQPPETDEARQRKSDLENEIKALELDLADHKNSLRFVGPWGIMLLDPGESSISLVYQYINLIVT